MERETMFSAIEPNHGGTRRRDLDDGEDRARIPAGDPAARCAGHPVRRGPMSWPLSADRSELVDELIAVLRRDGGARFVTAPVVCADARDFPGRWTPTVAGASALLRLLCWHAHLDVEVGVEDARTGRPRKREVHTRVELVDASDGRATFRIDAVGNDDVAGLLALQVGRAYVALVGRDPFRGDTELPDLRTGAIAAVAIGLGVLVANAWRHDRTALAHRRPIRSLAHDEIALLLGLQALLCGATPAAFDTLHADAVADAARWRDELAPHRDELAAMLELSPSPLTRGERPALEVDTPDPPVKFNAGRKEFRAVRREGHPVLGMLVGAAGFLLGPVGGAFGIAAGGAVGARLGHRYWYCADPDCHRPIAEDAAECPGCGATFVGEIAHQNERLDREDELA